MNRTPRPIVPPDLESLRAYTDHLGGISERWVSPHLGGWPTVGVLTLPIGARRDLGWVICHSFGVEQSNLHPLEVAAARALGAAGYPVLRVHARGYGESLAPIEEVGLESHVADAAEACSLLVSATDVPAIGLLGARFGGAVAALAADRIGARAVIMWDPAVSGSAYLNSVVRAGLVIELAGLGRASGASTNPAEILATDGVLDVQGFPVTRRAFEEISLLSLASRLERFRGNALVVQVSRGGRTNPGLERLVGRLRELGGDVTFDVVTDPEASRFGLPRYLPTGEGDKDDRQGPLSANLIERTMAWCVQRPAVHAQRGAG
jgi:pimeloyl-ACP methyl ester carboxylesterase